MEPASNVASWVLPWLLPPRHERVAHCLLKGWSNKRIARELGLSPRTVANYVSDILEATGCESRLDFFRAVAFGGARGGAWR
jgi:two-component system nitrate/nitrite response regulator NarL